jgi:hypothetical protein
VLQVPHRQTRALAVVSRSGQRKFLIHSYVCLYPSVLSGRAQDAARPGAPPLALAQTLNPSRVRACVHTRARRVRGGLWMRHVLFMERGYAPRPPRQTPKREVVRPVLRSLVPL